MGPSSARRGTTGGTESPGLFLLAVVKKWRPLTKASFVVCVLFVAATLTKLEGGGLAKPEAAFWNEGEGVDDIVGRSRTHDRSPASPIVEVEGDGHLRPDAPVKVCGISAILGDYERSAKEPLEPLSSSDFPLFLVTDREDMLNDTSSSSATTSSSAWTKIRLDPSLWEGDCARPDFEGARNIPWYVPMTMICFGLRTIPDDSMCNL